MEVEVEKMDKWVGKAQESIKPIVVHGLAMLNMGKIIEFV